MLDIDLLLTYGGTFKKVRKTETIFNEGGKAMFYHQLVEGKLRWMNIDDEGREFIQQMIQPGECFGELPLFDGGPYAATAIADENSLIIRLHCAHFQQLLNEHPGTNAFFLKMMAKRLRYKFMLVKELSSGSPGRRITSVLKYMKDNHLNFCPKCNKLLLTRQQLANMTGLRVETVIRAIKILEEQKFLSIDKGKVYC